jgi:hypothetical protein
VNQILVPPLQIGHTSFDLCFPAGGHRNVAAFNFQFHRASVFCRSVSLSTAKISKRYADVGAIANCGVSGGGIRYFHDSSRPVRLFIPIGTTEVVLFPTVAFT